MGRFADDMLFRMRAKKNAKRIKHPEGAGVVMWCSQCRAEMLRAPKGKAPTMKAQRAAYEAHRAVCKMRHVMPVQREYKPIKRAKRRWPWVAALVLSALVATWLVVWACNQSQSNAVEKGSKRESVGTSAKAR